MKSPPTTPTILTSVKKLAEIEKCEAEPPSILSHLPKGVSTASNATEPTTRRDIGFLYFCLGLFNQKVTSSYLLLVTAPAYCLRCFECAQLFLRLFR